MPAGACEGVTGLICGSLLLSAQQSQPTPEEQQAKIRQVMEFYRTGITPEERIALIHPDTRA